MNILFPTSKPKSLWQFFYFIFLQLKLLLLLLMGGRDKNPNQSNSKGTCSKTQDELPSSQQVHLGITSNTLRAPDQNQRKQHQRS